MTDTPLYLCPSCGRVRASDPETAPQCSHGVGGPPVEMEPLPSWHPLAEEAP